MVKFYYSPSKQKILLLLLSGLAISLSRSPAQHLRVVKNIPRAWKEIDRSVLYRQLHEFYRDRLVDYKDNKDGTVDLVLTKKGKKQALHFRLDELEIATPLRWDKKWRLVMFDIPEKYKRAREALREKLRALGFIQVQKSVWVYPHPCEDVVNFIIEVLEIRRFVQVLEVTKMTNDLKIKLHFGLK